MKFGSYTPYMPHSNAEDPVQVQEDQRNTMRQENAGDLELKAVTDSTGGAVRPDASEDDYEAPPGAELPKKSASESDIKSDTAVANAGKSDSTPPTMEGHA